MSDMLFNAFRETGEITAELQRKAKEAADKGASRRDFFQKSATVTGGAALALAGLDVLKPATAFAAGSQLTCSCTTTDVLNIAATAELLAITFYYNALTMPSSLPQVNSKANRNYFQAALTEEAIHEDTLLSLGGAPLAAQFYFPEAMFTNDSVFFATAENLEIAFIGAYIAAAREFSGVISSGITAPFPTGIGLAIQTAGVECEHRALLRVAHNQNPPNNFSYERAVFSCVADAVPALKPFLQGGPGFSTTPYLPPSRSAIDSRAAPYGFAYFPKAKIV